MEELSRRRFVQASGLLAATLGTGACGSGSAGGSGKGLQWWGFRNPIKDLNKQMFAKYEKAGGMPVKYTYQQTSKMGQALQLAKQSDQLPDIFSPAGLKLPKSALLDDGWFAPLQWGEEQTSRLPKNSLFEGLHTFNGKTYSFPIFDPHQYWCLTWFNTELLRQAGYDPNNPPASYDEFRAACRAVRKKSGDAHGWIFNLGFAGRVREQVGFLAQAAGFEGNGREGTLFRTGEYAYHDDAYLTAIEFLLSLQRDGLMFPGSSSMNDKVARARWAAGGACFYFDGPWCPGVVSQDYDQFAGKLGVGPILVPRRDMRVATYKPPVQGAYWMSGSCKHPKQASELLGYFATEDYWRGLAENMVQPPLEPGVLDGADVHPAYRRAIKSYDGTAFLAPSALVKNPDVAKVQIEGDPVTPRLGALVQGMFSGDVTDIRGALKKLSDKSNAERERALGEARKKGAKVSLDDYAFPNWQPGQDYGADMYQ